MTKINLLKIKLENKMWRHLSKRDAGINALMVEAGLAIVGVVLILIVSTLGKDYLTDVMAKCLEKSLAILA